MNQYIWPILTYPFQTAPLHKLSQKFLMDIDKMIRSAAKEILLIPNDTPTSMIYSSKKFKGLGIFRSTWEAFIQNFNACLLLSKVTDDIIPLVRNLPDEMTICLKKLDLEETFIESVINPPEPDKQQPTKKAKKSSRLIRDHLQEREFESWAKLPHKGKGIEIFKEQPKFNKWCIQKEIYLHKNGPRESK